MTETLQLTIDFNVLNHLGLGLYSSTPAVVTEIVSNAWDAEATKVDVSLDKEKDAIVVEDDGHGMTREDVKEKFLNVGYSRRDGNNKGFSENKKRRVMGRKGIGKLAMFSLANRITVITKASGYPAVAFFFDVQALREDIKAKKPYNISEIAIPVDFGMEKGTRIVLESLNSNIVRTEKYLRPRLARRFAIMSPEDNFDIKINETSLTPADREYFGDIQFLWYFDEASSKRLEGIATNIAYVPSASEDGSEDLCIQKLDNTIVIPDTGESFQIEGFIATVKKTSNLGKDSESINQVSIFANKRVFQTDILNEIGDARLFNQYIIGEVHADFLDADDVDRATASRESVKHNDPKYIALSNHLKKSLASMSGQWDEWRVALKLDTRDRTNSIVAEWLGTLPDARDRKLAERMVGSINKSEFASGEEQNSKIKSMLMQSAISGFEKLRVRRQLDKLENVKDIFSPEFMTLFATMDDIEASYHLDITRQRLEVIEKFKNIIDAKDLEAVVHKYLFDHLWLLDPSWGRITGSEKMEETLSKYLKKVDPETEEGARVDIRYLTSSARHVIVELKRPGIKTSFLKLRDQATKYIISTREFFEANPSIAGLNGRIPPIDAYILVSERPKARIPEEEAALKMLNIEFLTYNSLIINAERAYQEYFDAQRDASRIDGFLARLRAHKF